MTTVLDLITNSLTEIGVVAAGETVTASDGAFALSKLNRMLDNWKTRRLYAYCINSAEFAFTTSKQSYTIGRSAADFTADRPVRIESASLVVVADTPDTYIPLEIMNVQENSDLVVPALSSTVPTRLYYQPTYPNGTLWPWPYPTVVTNKLELTTWNQISTFATLATVISLPPGYEEALTLSLAERLCGPFGKSLSPELADFARRARADIQSLNCTADKIANDYPDGGTSFFNIKTGLNQ